MAIKRTVETDVYCDVCGEWIIGWRSSNTGTSNGDIHDCIIRMQIDHAERQYIERK